MPEKVFIRGIPDQLWRAIKARASLEGITLSQAVQKALWIYLSGGDPSACSDPAGQWKGIVAIGQSGSSDVSDLHDHYLAEALRPNAED